MDWLTLEWLMKNLEWAVGLLAVGCLILFLFPVFLGYDLKKKSGSEGNILVGRATLHINFSHCYFNDHVKRTNENEKTN